MNDGDQDDFIESLTEPDEGGPDFVVEIDWNLLHRVAGIIGWWADKGIHLHPELHYPLDDASGDYDEITRILDYQPGKRFTE